MNKYRLLLTGFFGFLYTSLLSAQQEEGGMPASFRLPAKGDIEYFTFVAPDHDELLKEDSVRNSMGLKTLRFGYGWKGNWNPLNSGQWDKLEDGTSVWRIAFFTPGAFSVNTAIHGSLPDNGSKIFIYAPGYKNLLGGYSANSFSALNEFQSLPVSGERIIIEYNIPPGTDENGDFYVKQIVHAYRDLFYNEKNTESFLASGSCNIDINCPEGENWQDIKKGVMKMIIRGTELCTGSLINTTANDGRPYVLTAGHCIESASDASNSLFLFGYERTVCKGTSSKTPLSISGCKLLATATGLDFSLVQLNTAPSAVYSPLYLAWTIDTFGIMNSTTIHHPSGDVKKISLDYEVPVTGNFGLGYDDRTHWQIKRWDKGTTEGGSSGAPLFNQKREIIGTLTGGDATCTNSINDFYQQIHHAWADYPDSSQQLKYWLDPLRTGEKRVSVFDPFRFSVIQYDTISNIPPGTSTSLKSSGNGFIAGTNTSSAGAFAERFVFNDTITLTGVFLELGMIKAANSESWITLKIWNGQEFPDSIITSQKIYLSQLSPSGKTFIPLWKPRRIIDTVYVGFELNQIFQDTVALKVSDMYPDEILSSAFVFQNETWSNFSSFYSYPASLSLDLQVCDATWLKINKKTRQEQVKVFPNPSFGDFQISAPAFLSHSSGILQMIDLSGRVCYTRSVEIGENPIRIQSLSLYPGIYMILLQSDKQETAIGRLVRMAK